MKNLARLCLIALTVVFNPVAALAQCDWCVTNNATREQEILRIAAMQPLAQLAYVRAQGVCVKVLDSGRRPPKNLFYWAQVEQATGSLTEVTQIKNVMGKTFCKGEIAFADQCNTIAIASDAPRSTLLHEFLHLRQLESDKAWCKLSRALWSRKATEQEARVLRDKEWDVHRLLWKLRKQLSFGLEDQLTVVAETLEEAQAREKYDAEAGKYVARERMAQELERLMKEYRAHLGVK